MCNDMEAIRSCPEVFRRLCLGANIVTAEEIWPAMALP